MRPTTLVRLALAGTRTDGLRVLLTAFSALLATLAALAAATVLAIPTPGPPGMTGSDAWSKQYRNALLAEPGLRPGVAITMLLLMIPILALAGQCARLGAPARDRRLAAIRLAGATPGQTVLLAVAEAGLASLFGSAAGLATYLVGRRLLDRPGADGKLALPTDVLPPAWVLAVVVLGLPLLAALATAILLRRVTVSPFGTVRSTTRTRAPGSLPGILIVLGLVVIGAAKPLYEWYGRTDREPPVWLFATLLAGGSLLAMLGVVTGAAWISYTVGRLLHRTARRPAALLAARRLLADPWSGSRTFTALLACLIFGAGAAAFRAYFVTTDEVRAEMQRLDAEANGLPPVMVEPDPFYVQTMDLINIAVVVAMIIAAGGLLVAVAEGIVSRRRTYAALVATGVPRRTLGRSIAWQVLAPALPAILVAVTVGQVLGRMAGGDRVTERTGSCDPAVSGPVCQDPEKAWQHTRWTEVSRVVDVPLEQLALLGGGALAAVLATVAIGLLFLRASTTIEELRVG
ncbi:ABC transporter permease [Plantactinospora sp. GCM10030261]|uniref:ABC transporter permease n=1 Tax=Plantactinospora sp. GCM10030261 TaxID=3273420 RepID=UPI00361C50C3